MHAPYIFLKIGGEKKSMDPTILAFVSIFAGALCAVVIPYLLGKMYDPEKPDFDISYIYGMIITLVASSFLLIPEEINTSFQGIMTLFLAGLGLEGSMNTINSVRIKGKKKNK